MRSRHSSLPSAIRRRRIGRRSRVGRFRTCSRSRNSSNQRRSRFPPASSNSRKIGCVVKADRAPPLFVSVGGAESSELRRQSADYLHAWKAAGLSGWSFEQPEANHFMAIAGFIDKESKLCASLRRLVKTCEAG